MKRTLLAITLLSIPYLFSESFEATKASLDNQQAAVEAAEKQVAEIRSKIEAGSSQLAAAAGKSEHAAEIDRLNEENRKLIEECNQAVATCRAENKKLQEVVANCTGGDREVVSEGGKYSLRPSEPKEVKSAHPAPVTQTVQTQAQKATRAPYAKQGRSYPRASSAYPVSE
jgi:hypothetical protein